MGPLRILSYLAPSIPAELFEIFAQHIETVTKTPTRLDFETRVSGPTLESDPFAADLADLAFVCAPSYPLLRGAGSPVVLLPVAPVFADPRAIGRPVYFSDVVVPTEAAFATFADLRGSIWAYNDKQSRSGWGNMLARLAAIGHAGGPETYFRELLHAGSHIASLESVLSGSATSAAIDSNTLALARRRDPRVRSLRVIESWGPTPIQPVLAASALRASLRGQIIAALRSVGDETSLRGRFDGLGFQGFADVDERDYASIPTSLPGGASAHPTA